jgi:hypothetical protein
VIKICKAIVSGSAPEQIREQTQGLVSAPLRELAAQLASDPGLTVSVITYDDGRQELEILHTGPPHHTEDTIDTRRFTRQPQQAPARSLSIIGPGGLQDAVALVRGILLDAPTP